MEYLHPETGRKLLIVPEDTLLAYQRNFRIETIAAVASENKGDLEKLAAEGVCAIDPNKYVELIKIVDPRELKVGDKTVYYAVAIGYIGN